ncbi:Clo7bot family Cys-rich peptide [Caloranaerobacter ferrireducens]|nr:Clo7bot family Cys-rich peptide [Caloranaerobacter ferrireducens]
MKYIVKPSTNYKEGYCYVCTEQCQNDCTTQCIDKTS